MKILKVIGAAALLTSLVFNVSCGDNDSTTDSSAPAQGTVNTDLGNGNINTTTTPTDINGNPIPFPQNGQNIPQGGFAVQNPQNNAFVQDVQGTQSVVVNSTEFAQPIVQFATVNSGVQFQSAIRFNNVVYNVVPTQSFINGTNFVTVYTSNVGPSIQVMGTFLNNTINCNVVLVRRNQPVQTLSGIRYIRTW